MKTQITTLLLAAVTFTGIAQKRNIDIDNFSGLSFGIPGTLYLTQGSNEKVEIDCSDSIFEKIVFKKKDDRLIIKNRNDSSWKGFGRSDVGVYITMRDIESIELSGSGSVVGENKISGNDLSLAISGSGDMQLSVATDNISMKVSGSGDIRLEGSSDSAKTRISGSGKVKAEDLKVKTMQASISGSGNCYVNVSEEIKASISGSGDIYYSGNPNRVDSHSSGSGKVRKLK